MPSTAYADASGRRAQGCHGRPPLCARALALLLPWALAACASHYEPRDWSDYTGPGAEWFQREELPFPAVGDPLEPANRAVSIFNYGVLRFVIAPTARVYRGFVPEPARRGVRNFGRNLLYPVRLTNNLLQAKWRESWTETQRFALNTVVGFAGLADPASERGLRPSQEDLGQTLAKWGWRESVYLQLPVLGPSSVRDALGRFGDAWLDPLTYFYFVFAPARVYNEFSDSVEETLDVVHSLYDAYEPLRFVWTASRVVDATDFAWIDDESGEVESLQTIFLQPDDVEFIVAREEQRVRLSTTGRELPYSFWLQPEPAPLTYLLPGLGGHRSSGTAVALAEILYDSGNSVVVISNAMNWEFLRYGSSAEAVGYAPQDARDVHAALSAIDRQLARRYPERFTTRRLGGISLGALHALHIAAAEAQAGPELVAFDLYVAIGAPVDYEFSMRELDRCYNAPLAFPPEKRDERIEDVFAKVLYLSQGRLDPELALPFSEPEAKFLIGMVFRQTLQEIILETERMHRPGVLQRPYSRWRRAPLYREISEYSFLEYAYAYALPWFASQDGAITLDDAGAERMFAASSLAAIAEGLRANPKVRVFANENDFLLRPGDAAWLRELLGERMRSFEDGGHLGNLHRSGVQAAIRDVVREAEAELGIERAREVEPEPATDREPEAPARLGLPGAMGGGV